MDPALTNLDPRQFMIDLGRTIRGFNGLLESIKDEEAFVDTEMALADLAEKMEDLGDQSMGLTAEPKEEDREDLYRMIGELQEQVVRLETIGEQKRDNRELWKRIDPLYNRFDSAMRMIPMIPPAGYRDPATP